VYVTYESNGAFIGYTNTQTLLWAYPNPATGCGALNYSTTSYPAISQNCLRQFQVTQQGAPVGSAISQEVYNPLNQSWYTAVRQAKQPIIYATVPEPVNGRPGIVYAAPLYSNATGFLGAVEVYVQTDTLAAKLTGATSVYANVSYIFSTTGVLIATSQTPSEPLLINNIPVQAVNSNDEVISASANYLISQGVTLANTLYYPLTPTKLMEISILPVTYLESVRVDWYVVVVNVIVQPSVAPAATSAPTPSSGTSSFSSLSRAQKV
jgi:hypothetical protein